jgi:alcohol dehydrogenase class IV
MLPVALGVNRPVCEPQLAQLAQSAGLAGNVSQTAAADALVERVDQICQRLAIPRSLAQWNVSAEQLADLVRDSRGNSMDGNPRSLSDPELTQILEALL